LFDRTLLQLPGDHLPRPHGNCYWLIPGRLIAGEYPRTADEAASRIKLAAILATGVRQFIDLTEATEPLENYATLLQSVAADSGCEVRHDRFPIEDLSIPQPEDMRAILRMIGDAHCADRPVYLHCWGGIGRTGTVVGCLLVECGFTPEEAIALIARKWMSMDKRNRRPQSPETKDQFAYIHDWSRLRGMTPLFGGSGEINTAQFAQPKNCTN